VRAAVSEAAVSEAAASGGGVAVDAEREREPRKGVAIDDRLLSQGPERERARSRRRPESDAGCRAIPERAG